MTGGSSMRPLVLIKFLQKRQKALKVLVALNCLKYGFKYIFLFGPCRTVQQERYGILRVVNSTGADTGEYACYPLRCEGTDCRREYDKAAKVFVFFPGTKPMRIFILHLLLSNKTRPKTNHVLFFLCFVFFHTTTNFFHANKKRPNMFVYSASVVRGLFKREHKVYWASNLFIVLTSVFIWTAWCVPRCYHSNSDVTMN